MICHDSGDALRCHALLLLLLFIMLPLLICYTTFTPSMIDFFAYAALRASARYCHASLAIFPLRRLIICRLLMPMMPYCCYITYYIISIFCCRRFRLMPLRYYARERVADSDALTAFDAAFASALISAAFAFAIYFRCALDDMIRFPTIMLRAAAATIID